MAENFKIVVFHLVSIHLISTPLYILLKKAIIMYKLLNRYIYTPAYSVNNTYDRE